MAETSERRVACPHCGKAYRWKPDLAGRKARCKCGQKVRFPKLAGGVMEAVGPPPTTPEQVSTYDLDLRDGPESGASSDGSGSGDFAGLAAVYGVASDEADANAAEKSKCPGCNQSLKAGAVICLNCGFNLKSGKQLETAVVEASAEEEADEAETAEPAEGEGKEAGAGEARVRALNEQVDEAAGRRQLPWMFILMGVLVVGILILMLLFV